MIHGPLVVTVVSGSVLLAVNFIGKAVDVDRRVCDVASSRGDDMILNPASQAVSHGFQIGRIASKYTDQTRLGWLICQSLVNNLIAIAIPDSCTKRRVMSEPIDIVLGRVSNGHGKDAFTNEFIDLVANPIRPPWVLNFSSNRIE